jgi:hypothetical protein
MDLIGEFFIELIFRRIIVGVFGFYTLLAFCKLTNNQKGVEWLNGAAAHEGEEFGKGCLISIVGLISFTSLFMLIGYVVMLITD